MPAVRRKAVDEVSTPTRSSKRQKTRDVKYTEVDEDAGEELATTVKSKIVYNTNQKVGKSVVVADAPASDPDVVNEKSSKKLTAKVKSKNLKSAPTEKRKKEVVNKETATTKEPVKKKVVKSEEAIQEETKANGDSAGGQANGSPGGKKKIHRKTKEEKEAEMIPLAARTAGLRMFVGAHVSCAKGVQNSVTNAAHIGGNAFAMFFKSQRKWENPPLQDEHATLWHSACKEHKFEASKHILPHGSYLVNLAQMEKDKSDQAFASFLDDLQRCERLGIRLYNFHPGNTGSQPRSEAIERIANCLNRAHLRTNTVITVLETMAGGNNVIGSTFEDIRDIIALVTDKSRIGVCLDTCHVFAAGYDLRKPEKYRETMEKFDKIIGLNYLRGLHMNDSKAPFGSHRDLHQNIGLGFLGLRAFHNVMNDERLEDLPLILETPTESKTLEGKEDKRVWAVEIKLLESLIGMKADSDGFRKLEKELSDRGAEEREKHEAQHGKKLEKEKRTLEKWIKRSGHTKQRGNSHSGSDDSGD